WGRNNDGQLGNYTTTNKIYPSAISVSGTVFTSIATCNYSSMAISNTGEIYTWGNNKYGQLGDGSTSSVCNPIKRNLTGVKFTKATGGLYSITALNEDGEYFYWGQNSNGQYGNGSSLVLEPKPIETSVEYVKVLSGLDYTIALSTEGYIYTWGSNYYGQLGDGTTTNRTEPYRITSGRFIDISAGYYSSAAINADGDIYTWGRNNSGQLGNGTLNNKSIPTKVNGSIKFQKVSCGEQHTLALSYEGDIYSWGRNDEGQLGNNSLSMEKSPIKITVTDKVFDQVSAGQNFSMALSKDGYVYCWGDNSYGQIGNDSTTNQKTPLLVSSLIEKVAQISAGSLHSVILTKYGDIYTWGCNSSGQLGNGTNILSLKPIKLNISGINFVKLSCSSFESVAAITSKSQLYVWGLNDYGQLGDGTKTNKDIPTLLTIEGETFNNISMGFYHTTVVSNNNNSYSWGNNQFGALGYADSINYTIPNYVETFLVTKVTYDYATNKSDTDSIVNNQISANYIDVSVTDDTYTKFLGWNIDSTATTALESLKIIKDLDELTLYAIYDDCLVTFPEINYVSFELVDGYTNPTAFNSSIKFKAIIDSRCSGTVSLKKENELLIAINNVYTIDNITDDIIIMNNGTTTTVKTYSINYVNAGINNENPINYNIEDANIILKNPSRIGYTFIKWTEGEIINTTVGGNVTRTAEWSLNYANFDSVNGYTGTYDKNAHQISVQASHALSLNYELAYQWYKYENKISGAINATYNVTSVTESGNYFCKVTITDGTQVKSITSNAIVVSLDKANPIITVDQNPIIIVYGETVITPEATSNLGVVNVEKPEMVNVGEYTITYTVEGIEDYNTDIKTVKVIIRKKAITVIADSKTIIKGETDVALTYKLNDSILVGSDVFSGELTRASGIIAG
ncbi:MAG: hypothetical protein WCR54_08845, partial [Clostridia bacterium]